MNLAAYRVIGVLAFLPALGVGASAASAQADNSASQDGVYSPQNSNAPQDGAYSPQNSNAPQDNRVDRGDWVNVVPGATSREIALGGEVIMRFREGAGGYSPEERAGIVRERLASIGTLGNLEPSDITVRRGPADTWAAIYVKNQLLVTVSEPLAQANNTSPVALARLYADRFRRILPEVQPLERDPRTGAPMMNRQAQDNNNRNRF